ncbi:MAG: glutamate--tRNA ligase, partial [Clostridiales bacterium]|nr:glutamate--tRNA ligase [Clostridiales bacterium]
PFEEFLTLATPWLSKVLDPAKFDFRRIAELLNTRTEVLNRIPEMVDFLAEMPEFDNELYTHKKMKTDPAVAKAALAMMRPVLEGVSDWTEESLHAAIMERIPETGMKTGQVLWPLRIALSGKASTPGGAVEIAYLLGRDEALRRLEASRSKL